MNTAVGSVALTNNTTGADNVAIGAYALDANTTGGSNTASGKDSLPANTTGSKNIGIGNNSGNLITTGSNNTVIGELSGTATMADTVLIGAGTTERLKVNSTGLYVNGVLSGGGGVNITSNATAPSSPAVGDQWYDTTNGVLYVRVTDGTDAAWLDISSANGTAAAAAAAAGGAWTVISSQTVSSAVASLEFLNSVSSTYSHYVIKFESVLSSSDAYNNLQVDLSANGGTTWHSQWNSLLDRTSAGTPAFNDASVATLGQYVGSMAPSSGVAHFFGLSSAVKKSYFSTGVTQYDTGHGKARVASSVGSTSLSSSSYMAVVDSLKVRIVTANLTAGTFTLYGIKTS